MRRIKTCIVLVICALMLVPNVVGETYTVTDTDTADVTFQSETEATNVPPSIDENSFALKLIADENEVYPTGDRARATLHLPVRT